MFYIKHLRQIFNWFSDYPLGPRMKNFFIKRSTINIQNNIAYYCKSGISLCL